MIAAPFAAPVERRTALCRQNHAAGGVNLRQSWPGETQRNPASYLKRECGFGRSRSSKTAPLSAPLVQKGTTS